MSYKSKGCLSLVLGISTFISACQATQITPEMTLNPDSAYPHNNPNTYTTPSNQYGEQRHVVPQRQQSAGQRECDTDPGMSEEECTAAGGQMHTRY